VRPRAGNCLPRGKGSKSPVADGAVGMNLELLVADDRLHRARERACPVRRKQTARIFDIEEIDVRTGRQFRGHVGIELVVVGVRQSKRQGCHDLGVALFFDDPRCLKDRVAIMHWLQHDEPADPVDLEAPVDEPHEIGVGLLPGDEAEPRSDEL